VTRDPRTTLRSPGVRAALLALVLAMVVMSLAVPLRSLLRQSDENRALAAAVADREQRIADLEEQVQQWGDDEFVRQQARERLKWAFPGETGYVVIDPNAAAEKEEQLRAAGMPGSWYERLWRSYEDSAEPGR